MSAFPSEPVSPKAFLEDVVPELFSEVELPEAAVAGAPVDLKLGISLRGDTGGEWTLHLVDAELIVQSGLADDCNLTLVQSVVDWRSALWEGRPALFADAALALRRGGVAALEEIQSDAPSHSGIQNPAALRELEQLPGLIEATIAGEEEDAPDWRVGVKIGPGPIPDTPAATICIGAAEADRLRTGELNPVEALITGQLRLEGDLGLVIQLQAILMAASMPPPTG